MAESYDLVIRGARVLGRPADKTFDLGVAGGKIRRVSAHVSGKSDEEIEAKGRLILPGFYNMHFHLDSVLKVGTPGTTSAEPSGRGFRSGPKSRTS